MFTRTSRDLCLLLATCITLSGCWTITHSVDEQIPPRIVFMSNQTIKSVYLKFSTAPKGLESKWNELSEEITGLFTKEGYTIIST
mgnify:CR=1 FL=1